MSSMILATLLASAFAAQNRADEIARDLMFREVLPPSPIGPSESFSYQIAKPIGDSNNDGYQDLLMGGHVVKPIGSTDPIWTRFQFFQNPLERLGDSRPTSLMARNDFMHSEVAGILSGGGRKYILAESTDNLARRFIRIIDSGAPDRYRDVYIPQSSTGLPDARNVSSAIPAGDLNGDGWDEIYYDALAGDSSGTWFVCGILDGKTSASIWQRHFANCLNRIEGVNNSIGIQFVDFNSDGIRDFVSGYQKDSYEYCIAAVSGTDGSTIWSYIDQPNFFLGYRSTTTTHDINGDGVVDSISVFRGYPAWGQPTNGWAVAIDGSNGSQLWKTSFDSILDQIEVQFGPGVSLSTFNEACVTTPSLSPTSSLEVWIPSKLGQPLAGNPVTEVLICLNAGNGEWSGVQKLPFTFAPWSSNQVQDLYTTWSVDRLSPIGDVDGDGHIEFAKVEGVLDSHGNLHSVLGIFGHRSLYIPITQGIGEEGIGTIFIPGASSLNWKLLSSAKFDPIGGTYVSGWPTNLNRDQVFDRSWNFGPTGRLNRNGIAEFNWTAPTNPALSGLTLYCRAIIQNPVKPDQMATVSTIEITRIQ